jgi:Ca2+-binding EF-hand superfamily protein
MAKKKKIREEFDIIFKSGNEKAIKEMLDKYPWLLSEVSSEMEKDMGEQQKIVAALGVMEDELGGTVPVDEIVFSLKVDFNSNLTDEEVLKVLKDVEELGLVKRETNGWILTREGGKICDDYLNKNLEDYS